MNTKAALKSYAKVHYRANVESASPHRLIDMLYEGAIDRIVQAKGAMEYGNIELKGNKINSAISIVGGLRESLDVETGGELAKNLDNLYLYVLSLLTKAHIKNESGKLEEAHTLLCQMRATWKQIGE